MGGQNSLTFLCINLFDLDTPIREALNCPPDLKLPFDIILCILLTIIMSKFTFTSKLFKISPLPSRSK